MSRTLSYVETLEVTTCFCGIHMAMPTNLLRNARDYGADVYCPIGHKFGWNETKADRLAKQLAQTESRLADERQRRQAEQDLRLDTERRLTAQKAATTKAKKRHAAAVCPCCKRSFVQLRRHMAAKHPDYEPSHA